MPIPTELVGSLPRPERLQDAYQDYDDGKIDWPQLQAQQDAAAEDSIKRLEATGEPIVTDGEQRESSFATYSLTNTLAGTGLADNLAGDGQFFAIFDDGHHRQRRPCLPDPPRPPPPPGPGAPPPPLPLQALRVGVRREEQEDRDPGP